MKKKSEAFSLSVMRYKKNLKGSYKKLKKVYVGPKKAELYPIIFVL